MHFWIDKRSSQYTYTGRHRMPTTLSSGGVGRGRARVYGEVGVGVGVGRKPRAARRPPTAAASRRPRSNGRQNSQPVPVHNASRRSEASTIYMAVPPEPLPSIASLAAARCVTPDTLLRTAALGLPAPVIIPPHVKFGMLVSFALATLFLAGAKYYFDRPMVRNKPPPPQPGVSEAAAVLCALSLAAGLGCLLLRCRPEPPPLQPPDRISSTARVPPPPMRPTTTATTSSEPSPSVSDDVSLTTLLHNRSSSPEAPPPYHIAVLLPTREASPPHYSDIS